MGFYEETYPDLRDEDYTLLNKISEIYLKYLKTKDMKSIKEIECLVDNYGILYNIKFDYKDPFRFYQKITTNIIEVMREDIEKGMYR